MVITDKAGVKGALIYTVYRKGIPIEHVEEHNLVVNGGRRRLAELISGHSRDFVTQIGFGTGTREPELTDVILDDLQTIDITDSVVDGTSVTFNWFLDQTHCNGMNITEFALFAADGLMLTHQQRGRIIGKEQDVTVKGQYILTF